MDELVSVETVKPHDNPYGKKPGKAKGDAYSLPAREAEQLIALEIVKPAKAAAAATPTA
jgi:hypothetical protein